MNLRYRILLCACCSWVGAAFAQQNSSPADISEILFPETKSWKLFEALPKVTPAQLASIRRDLQSAYKASKEARSLEVEDCSFLERIMDADNINALRTIDLDLDGILDVVYGGSALCAEGDVTLVWFGKKSGYALREFPAWRLMPLRLLPGKMPGVSAVASGCCGDPIDEYTLGTLEGLRGQGFIHMPKNLQMPNKKTKRTAIPFKSKLPVTLRNAPLKRDAYDSHGSAFMDHAVYGNILSRFLPGLSGTVLAEEQGKNGKSWLFVKLSNDNGPLRHDAPFKVEAGWIEK